jgi:hypothetical protein
MHQPATLTYTEKRHSKIWWHILPIEMSMYFFFEGSRPFYLTFETMLTRKFRPSRRVPSQTWRPTGNEVATRARRCDSAFDRRTSWRKLVSPWITADSLISRRIWLNNPKFFACRPCTTSKQSDAIITVKQSILGQGLDDPRGLGSLVFIMGQTGLQEYYRRSSLRTITES